MDEYEKYDHGALLRARYQKCGDISEGSYGLVSLAKDTLHGDTLVAVKFIFPLGYKRDKNGSKNRPSSSPAKLKSPNLNAKGLPHSKESILNGLYEEAEKEIKIHKILGIHANISALYDHFDSYLILEYCTRGDLYEAIHNNNGPSTSQDIKDVFMQILNALEFCHANGVYHRDLKPENILIGEDWSIKICDWGLATTTRIITDKDEFDIGSERYMAPELFDSDLESYDASKIDLWSVGVILLTLVFHKNPFQVANYSDKRFIQFAGNREALFDIFSSMSGDMFSVLRVCLNIDPANRSLENTKSELEVLRFFTIEEEYYGSDYEEDEAEDDLEVEEEDYTFKKNSENIDILPQSPVKKLISTAIEGDKISQDKVSSSLSTTDNDSIRGGKTLNHPRVVIEDFPIPHNHRADALLSSNTDLKPIPIGSFGNGAANKLVRNTRKPFNVASYNQSHNSRFQTSKFNREDFFTPKSVFNHYMDKYGEQRFNNIDSKIISPSQTNAEGKRRKVRSWKKNNRKNKPSGKTGRHSRHELSQHLHTKDESSSHNNTVSNKRKSRSFSASKARKVYPSTTNQPTSNVNGGANTNGNAILSTFHMLQPGTPYSYGSSATSTGKYAPPHLRSPNYAKSPVIEPLTEEIERLNLNDYDEVFHLEDDFDLGGSVGGGHDSEKQKFESDSSSQSLFKKPNFKSANIVITESDKPSTPVVSDSFLGNGIPSNGVKGAMFAQKRPVSMQESTSNLSSSANSTSGKYVPPFRRGSHSSGSQPIGVQTHLQPSLQPIIKVKPFDKKHKEDIGHNKFLESSIGTPIIHGATSGTSSSLNPNDFAYYRKDWSDYV